MLTGIFAKKWFKTVNFHRITGKVNISIRIEVIKSLPKLKKHYEFLKEVDSIALQKSVENLADSYDRYYKKQNKQPRFKSKKNPVQSYTTKHTNGNIAVIGNCIKLPKLGLVRFANSRKVQRKNYKCND